MREHYRPWARWAVRYTGLLLACSHLAVQWHEHPVLGALLPNLPGLRLVPDCTFMVALQRVRTSTPSLACSPCLPLTALRLPWPDPCSEVAPGSTGLTGMVQRRP